MKQPALLAYLPNETMTKGCCLPLFVLFIGSLLLVATTASASSTVIIEGFKLHNRDRKVIKIDNLHLSDHDTTLRQWNEDEYESIMNGLSGQSNLRHRNMQQQTGSYQNQQYYLPEQRRMAKWQIVGLVVSITGTVVFAYFAYTLRNELSMLTQYLPLGYRLFPAHDSSEEEDRPVGGVEMS